MTIALVPLGGDLQAAPDPEKVGHTATHMARERREATEAITCHMAGHPGADPAPRLKPFPGRSPPS
jgi:hypothetical protein